MNKPTSQNQRGLFKTTIIIWSEYDGSGASLEDLARDATSGESHCHSQKSEWIEDPKNDKDFSGEEFFGLSDELDEDQE
jgi:hypothetical protein